MRQQVREFETKISGLTSRNVELEAANSSLQKRLADLVKEMGEKEADFRNEMARKVSLSDLYAVKSGRYCDYILGESLCSTMFVYCIQ